MHERNAHNFPLDLEAVINRANLGIEVMHERNAHNFPLDLEAVEVSSMSFGR